MGRLKRPADLSKRAKMVVDIAAGDVVDDDGKDVALARAGVRGGTARAKVLSPDRRVAIAKMAAKARWKRD